MPAFEWVHVQLHQQKGMISLSPPTICNSAIWGKWWSPSCRLWHRLNAGGS
ncbi:putative transposase [Escherichia coli 8-415-05_S4_C1]|nr:putative transposase [Escherichia coli 1-176-05_S1_C1]KDT40853.1 putative transposase [Escherichia coli 3-105-05_S4_C2]KDT43262.1 putative transposase [Escherichia coli 3-105-05_S3_C2]KDW99603.1 putative transposase [Escherichia coli 2-177-06_S4_C3]KDY80875.1 putative transposase [Escherichia coli 2-474-04_S3_C1]KEJ18124.1 putative transposase [Escherichia coli 8-415-05_S4_C2]KEJ20282.1 putative transposase [Escherichia coli 8-415-05_S4_C1]KEJ24356.1 putative transposase [Escherichia coli